MRIRHDVAPLISAALALAGAVQQQICCICCSFTPAGTIYWQICRTSRWQQSDGISAALPRWQQWLEHFRYAPHPRSQLSSRFCCCAAETAQPKEIIDRTRSSHFVRALANILLHLLSVRSADAELICGGASRLNFTGREGVPSKHVMLAARAAGL